MPHWIYYTLLEIAAPLALFYLWRAKHMPDERERIRHAYKHLDLENRHYPFGIRCYIGHRYWDFCRRKKT